MGPLVVAVDLSTTACKVFVVDAGGMVISTARAPLATSSTRPGWQEQDAEDWWSALCRTAQTAVADVEPARLRAMCITHQRETFVCLDADDRPLRPAILWLDSRARHEVDRLGSPEVHRISGRPPSTTPSFYKLAWLQRHEPEVLARTTMVADVHAFLVHRLTGQWRTSAASADGLGLVDLQTFRYSTTLLDRIGLPEGVLPQLTPPGELIGRVTEDAAAHVGLPAGLAIIAGAGDGQCAGLGAAVCHPGTAYLNLGTAVTLGVHADAYRTALAFRTLASPIAGRWTLEAALASGVHALEWFRREVLRDGSAAALARVEAQAARAGAGADGLLFLPYLVRAETPHWDAAARGAWVGLRDHHGLGHLYRAVLEGIAHEQRLILGLIEAETGEPVGTVRVTGGGGRSRLWVRILADILERPLEVSAHLDSTALGAAALAMSAADPATRPDPAATARRMSGRWRTVRPAVAEREAYDRGFAAYQALYPALAEVFGLLDASRSGEHEVTAQAG